VYAVKASWWLTLLAPPNLVWRMPATHRPTVYLSFDDGPHPVATPFVLRQLAAYNAKATFFCIGKCVAEHPDIFKEIQTAGHSIGNHTHNHLNGWKVSKTDYLQNIRQAEALIPGRAFRPPYGRISRAQAKALHRDQNPWTIYMWTILSGDFDKNLTPEDCLRNILDNLAPGAIVVFHDSAKAWDRLRYALPFVLDYCKEKGWDVEGLPMS
jgi:peptidoglycan/xylan/chitin deacetylase (PgdA/CDA1 family)